MKRFIALLFCLLSVSSFGQAILRNYFTTNQNPQVNFTNGTMVSTNIYVSNVFATNITVNNITNINEFRGRTTFVQTNNNFYNITTNVNFSTTNETFYTFVTNNLFATTNETVFNITTNVDFSTTNENFYTFVTNIANITTNETVFNITTNVDFSTTNENFYTFVTNNLFATTNENFFTFVTNQAFITTNFNNYNITTNLFVSNSFFTNITVDAITNNTFVTTNALISNAFITNIFLQVAQYTTNKWIGPTNDVDFVHGVYQQFTASTDLQITGFKNASPTNENTTVLIIDPGGASRTLYFPNNWTNYTIDKANAYPIGSTNIAIVTLSQYGQQYTNVIVRLWGVDPKVGTITVSGLTNTSLTANTVLQADANQAEASIANATGALTNNGSGTFGWYNHYVPDSRTLTVAGTGTHVTSSAGAQDLTANRTWTLDVGSSVALVDANNAWTSASSNYVNSATGYATNSNTTTPDFATTGAESLLKTNANFTWLAPTHVDQSGKVYQLIVIDVTNSSGSAITMTLPANVHQGNAGAGLVVTNFSKVFFEYWPPSGPTSAYHVPTF